MAGPSLDIIEIDDPGDPRIAEYANLTDAQLLARALDPDRPEAGLFMAEGELVVRQLIASPYRVRSVLLTPARLRTMSNSLKLLPRSTPIYSAPQPVMDGIAGFHIHRGILAAGERLSAPELGELLGTVRTLVVLEDLANHDNVGGIFRTVAALAGLPRGGADGHGAGAGLGTGSGAAVLFSPRTCDPLYRKAIRVSMGAALQVPFAKLDPWPGGLDHLRAAGFGLIALTPDPEALAISEVNMNGYRKFALLLGAEGPGLSPEAFATADLKVRIPIHPPMDSLNVVVAAGIALHRLVTPG